MRGPVDAAANDALLLRPARPHEASGLSALALASKAHWGYDPAFLEACRAELTVTSADIEGHVVEVLEVEGAVRGFFVLRPGGEPGAGNLDFLYVDPPTIGKGYGRVLWERAVALARRRGYGRLLIHSDPHAEGFYAAMGAFRAGDVASGSVPGRRLPLLRFDLTPPF